MASTSGSTRQLENLTLSDPSCAMDGADESMYFTALATEAELIATTSSSVVSAMHGARESVYFTAPATAELLAITSLSSVSARDQNITKGLGRGECSGTSVEEQIEQSKSHWSILAKSSAKKEGEEVAEVDNVQVFKALQMEPTYGRLFCKFNRRKGGSRMVVGKKFAEGGQAELYEAQVKWSKPKKNERDLKKGTEWVLKVFKKGTSLRHLQSQAPHGYLQIGAQGVKRWKPPSPEGFPRLLCRVEHVTLMKDGRFAFLLQKEHYDLRSLIDRRMKSVKSGEYRGPFAKEEAEYIMFSIALGMDWLHGHDIVHKDLKASNVLMNEFEDGYPQWCCFIADYECSIGVEGTGFFRAPEILQACKDGKLSQRPELFTKVADVYSYGMTCYEILTGQLPFDGHPLDDYDLVLSGQRPMVVEYVEHWKRELLRRCWQSSLRKRPTFREILSFFLMNSVEAREFQESLENQFGENFRNRHHTETLNS